MYLTYGQIKFANGNYSYFLNKLYDINLFFNILNIFILLNDTLSFMMELIKAKYNFKPQICLKPTANVHPRPYFICQRTKF